MKVAILGYGIEGQAAYDYWSAGNEITICDHNESLAFPEEVTARLGADYLSGLDEFDIIVRSPFVHPRQIIEANDEEILSKVTSNTNEFMRVCPTRNIIGVTGTKGKGTTSTLITKMLETAGKTVHLGGNIGTAALDLLKQDIQVDDFVVLELSSFQLIDLRTSPHIAVCLMVVPEHLNWHEDFEEYVAAKQQLFINQSESDLAIYYAGNQTSVSIAEASEGKLIPYYQAPGAYVEDDRIVIVGQTICQLSELRLLGGHNWQNVCAAITAVWQTTQDVGALHSVLTSFGGLQYRLEFVREVSGVRYYNDSFGTTPETAIVAMQAFSEPKVIILGGSSKGADFGELLETVRTHDVRAVVLIGTEEAPRLRAGLTALGYDAVYDGGPTMAEVVRTAQSQAAAGDVVLLSTGCASFDMFTSYKDRGNQFVAAVEQLS